MYARRHVVDHPDHRVHGIVFQRLHHCRVNRQEARRIDGGVANRTVAGLTGPVMSYHAVMPDLRAAHGYAQATWPGEPVLLWGSSYAADLVIALGTEGPDGLAGRLAFSPVGVLRDADLVEAASRLAVPLFLTHATADGERAVAQAIAAAVPEGLATLDDPEAGAHGSVTLLATYNPGGH